MSGCDYCDEGLPLWHRREGDELEPAQLIPCSLHVTDDRVLSLISRMIDAGFPREEISLVRDLARGRTSDG